MMKCLIACLSIICAIIPSIALAGWQVAAPRTAAVPSEPFFQTPVAKYKPCRTAPIKRYANATFPKQFVNLGRPAPVYAISVSGSLKDNLERIMDRYHWHVIWKVGYDYNFDGRVTGSSLPNVIEKILNPFPLQATMYMSNRTMIVTSRKA